MLQSCELNFGPDDDTYPIQAMHVYAENIHCNEWNKFLLSRLPGQEFIIPAIDGKSMCQQIWQKSNSQTNQNETQQT